jgi:toxic protein SymE
MAKRNHKPEPCSAKGKFPYHRRLKVRSGDYDYQFVGNRHFKHKPIPVPWVQIKGYWLNQAGFPIGTELQVKISKKRIVLTPVSPGG